MNYLNLITRFIALLVFLNASASSAARPNVLLLAIDDLRPEIGCYGATHMVTPHMDHLADQSMRFEQAYVQQAVCLPIEFFSINEEISMSLTFSQFINVSCV